MTIVEKEKELTVSEGEWIVVWKTKTLHQVVQVV